MGDRPRILILVWESASRGPDLCSVSDWFQWVSDKFLRIFQMNFRWVSDGMSSWSFLGRSSTIV